MLGTVGMRKQQLLLLQHRHGCFVGRWIDRQTDGGEGAAYGPATVLRHRGLLKQDCPAREAARGRGARGPRWPGSRARNHTPGALPPNLTVPNPGWGLQLGPPCVGARWHLPWAQPPRLSGLKCLYSVHHHYRFLNWGRGRCPPAKGLRGNGT